MNPMANDLMSTILGSVGRALIPKNFRPHLHEYLMKAGYIEVPYTPFGGVFFVSTIIAYFVFVISIMPKISGKGTIIMGALSFITFAAIMFLIIFVLSAILYFYWNIKIYNRTKNLELLLPDYLTLVSTNLKGGMSFEGALWSAIKPEFGILANEIGLVSKRVMTGNEVVEALTDFSMKYNSPILRRNMQLLTSELESGGKVVDIIDRIIVDMKKVQ